MLLVCVSALGFILVLLLLDKAGDLVNHICLLYTSDAADE